MYSYLIHIKSSSSKNARNLRRASSAITKLLSSNEFHLTDSLIRLPSIHAEMSIIEPTPPPENSEPLITHYQDEEYFILAYGDNVANSSTTLAERIHAIFQKKTISAVRTIDSCFSAVIINKRSGELYSCTDFIGRRKPYFYHTKGDLLISSHDLAIIATGPFLTEYDAMSVYSYMALDWSLAGESFLKEIDTVQPYEYLYRNPSEIRLIQDSIIATDEIRTRRIEIQKVLHKICQVIESQISYFSGASEKVRIDLTAGLDSRALLGLVLTNYSPENIAAHTMGDKQSEDVKVARYLAKKYGVSYRYSLPSDVSKEQFVYHSRMLSYALNGQTDSQRAIHPFKGLEDSTTPKFNGIGGEIYRGHYYHKPAEWSFSNAVQHLSSHNRIQNSVLNDYDIELQFRQNIRDKLDTFSQWTCSVTKTMDLFYLWERFGNWGGHYPAAPGSLMSTLHSPAHTRLFYIFT